jgi:uncharacterized membrane protein HdeD (DUF308 family)
MASETGNQQREKDLGVAGIVLLAAGMFQIVLSIATGFFTLAVVGALLTIAGVSCWSRIRTVPHPNL